MLVQGDIVINRPIDEVFDLAGSVSAFLFVGSGLEPHPGRGLRRSDRPSLGRETRPAALIRRPRKSSATSSGIRRLSHT
jgi:hypothetical protein